MDKIKLLIADDHEIVIMGLRSILSKYNDISIVAITSNGEDILAKIAQHKPHVVIMDIGLPDSSGIDITERITKDFPNIKVILHTSFEDEDSIIKGFEAGAVGYVPKTFKAEQLVEAIRVVFKGEKYIKDSVSEKFINSYFKAKKSAEVALELSVSLTKREIDILKHISDGLSNQETADQLDISVRTVEVHKHNIMKKLGIFSTAELVKYALKHNITTL